MNKIQYSTVNHKVCPQLPALVTRYLVVGILEVFGKLGVVLHHLVLGGQRIDQCVLRLLSRAYRSE